MALLRARLKISRKGNTNFRQTGAFRPKKSIGGWAAILLLVFAGAGSGWAQAPGSASAFLGSAPARPTGSTTSSDSDWFIESHGFWDKTNLTLHGANLAAQGLDYWSTRKLIRRGFRETNASVRPFAGSDAAMAVHKFGLSFGGTVAASYFLHRTGRHRWERLATMFVLGTTAPAVGLNFRYVF